MSSFPPSLYPSLLLRGSLELLQLQLKVQQGVLIKRLLFTPVNNHLLDAFDFLLLVLVRELGLLVHLGEGRKGRSEGG